MGIIDHGALAVLRERLRLVSSDLLRRFEVAPTGGESEPAVNDGRPRVLLTTRQWFRKIGQDTPLGILDLAPYLRTNGYNVDVRFLHRLPQKPYDIVGLSVFASDYGDRTVFNDLAYLKKRFPGAKIVVGGRWTHTADPETVAHVRSMGVDFHKGPGETYFVKDKPIDFTTYPSWSPDDLTGLGHFDNIVMTSRGCPYDCNFCHNIERKLSFFSAKRTADNIEMLFKAGKPDVSFVDDVFTVKVRHMDSILDACRQRGLPIEEHAMFFTHVNVIRDDTIQAMATFKPKTVYVGLESGDDGMLKRMSKGFTAAKAEQRIRQLSEHVPVFGLFMIGYPGETKASLENTLAFAERLAPYMSDVWVSLFQPVKGTVGAEEAKTHGRMLHHGFQYSSELTYVDNNLSRDLLIRTKKRILKVCKIGRQKQAA